MTDEISITIPWTPQPQVSPNTRNSARSKHDHHRANAGIAALAVRSHLAQTGVRWTCPDHPAMDITVAWGRRRNRQDLDNITAGCKGAIDGVTRELGFDDRRLISISVVQTRDPEGIGSTTITIRPATAEERRRAA